MVIETERLILREMTEEGKEVWENSATHGPDMKLISLQTMRFRQ